MKRLRLAGIIVFGSLVGLCNSAGAVTIEGKEFELFATMNSQSAHDQLGHWAGMSKFQTFIPGTTEGSTISVTNVELTPDLAGQTVSQFSLMGTSTTPEFDSGIASATLGLFGPSGQELLSADYLRAGFIDSTLERGINGQLDIGGYFTVTGGSFLTEGFDSSLLYVHLLFDNVYDISSGDIWANSGRIHLYREVLEQEVIPPVTGPDPVPVSEPASMLLLGSTMIALVRRRQNES